MNQDSGVNAPCTKNVGRSGPPSAGAPCHGTIGTMANIRHWHQSNLIIEINQ